MRSEKVRLPMNDPLRDADIHKRLAVVEFPGILQDLRNPKKAIEALGGEDAIRASIVIPIVNTAPCLNLNLRPGVGSSHSNISSEKSVTTANVFLLKITKARHDTPRRDSVHASRNSTERSGRKQISDAGESASRYQAVTANDALRGTLVGQISSTTRFRSLSDFQYHTSRSSSEGMAAIRERLTNAGATFGSRYSRKLDSTRRMAESEMAGESLFSVLKNFDDAAHKSNHDAQLDRLRPIRFTRTIREYGNAEYWFRQYGEQIEAGSPKAQAALIPGRPIGDDRRSDANRLGSLHHRVKTDVPTVPTGPHPSRLTAPVVRGRESFDALHKLLQGLFQKRPIWLRRALYEGIPIRLRSNFKRVIPMLAYSFQGAGPFYQAWIRYGYDPRKEQSSRQYQVVEVRCNHPVVLTAVDEQFRKKHVKENLTDDTFELPVNYTLAEIPTKKNIFVQVCDVEFAEVIAACKELKPTATFDVKFGFFTEDGFNRVTTAIKETLIKKCETFLGAEQCAAVKKKFGAGGTRVLRKKRRRVSLKEVMKPGSKLSLGTRRRKQARSEDKSVATAVAEAGEKGAVMFVKDLGEDEGSGGAIFEDGNGEAGSSAIDIGGDEEEGNWDEEAGDVEGYEIFGDDEEYGEEDEEDEDDYE